MCGIVGYLGKKAVVPVLLNSLKQLEYRGYDSSGLATWDEQAKAFDIVKSKGKLANLEAKLVGKAGDVMYDTTHAGLGHIRWATHGAPTDQNAHPHRSQNGTIVLVHNGIFENFSQLKHELQNSGVNFASETDTECAAHLFEQQAANHAEQDFLRAFQEGLHKLNGAYALCVLNKNTPNKLYVARNQAPLVIGVGEEGECFVASDTVALAPYTSKFIFLKDGQYAELSEEGIKLFNLDGTSIQPHVEVLQMQAMQIDKRGFKHFMLKEIHEQPDVVRNSLMGRLLSTEAPVTLFNTPQEVDFLLNYTNRVVVLGCGTSLNAGLVSKYFIEDWVGLPVEVEAAGEFRYRKTVIDKNTLVIAISQSGETADTLEALRQCMRQGAKTLVITNRAESTMAREVDSVLSVRAGVEVSVAATKSFTAQLIVLYLLALTFAEHRESLSISKLITLKQELLKMPVILEQTLATVVDPLHKLAKQYGLARDMLFIARGVNYAVALEGALKLKEISYIHAEGYSGAELKHGPIALLDPTVPVVAVLTEGVVLEKMVSNCQEAKARDTQLIGVTNASCDFPEGLFDELIRVPHTDEALSPLVTTIPLQLLAYSMAEYLGKDVDQPRNLAKSVTVE